MIRAVFLSAALAVAAPFAVAGEAAEQVIETAADQLAEGRLDSETLAETLDTPRIARFALGRHARAVEPGDLNRFTAAFETVLVETFDDHSQRFRGASIDVIGSVDRNERDSVVTTRVEMDGYDPQTIRWRLIERDGDWRVVDVEVAGLWLAIEQRAQITAILDRRGATLNDVLKSLKG